MISFRRQSASYYKPHIFNVGSDFVTGNPMIYCVGESMNGKTVVGYGVTAEEAYSDWMNQLPYKECQYHLEFINRGK